MVYILFLVPATLMNIFPEAFNSSTGEIMGNTILSNGITANQMLVSLTVASCIAAAVGTFITAFKANLPFAQGPSLAISTFITYTICVKMGYTYNEALAAVFLGGIVFYILNILKFERKIQESIPTNIKFAVTAGIGLFIAFMGMQKAHIVEANENFLVQLVNLSDLSSYNAKSALVCFFGIVFIAIMLIKHIHGAILIGKIACIFAAIPLGLISHGAIDMSQYSISIAPIAFKMDFAGLFSVHNSFGIIGIFISVVVIIASICIMDVFETMGTIIATDFLLTYSHGGTTGEKFHKVLKSDAIATSFGAAIGITNVSTYVESTAMVLEGGRTGLSGIITGILFIFTIFISPYASVVPSAATATTLIMSGILMMEVIKYINFGEIEEALPAFLTMAMIPMTYSIVTGISLGLISYTLIKVFTGKIRSISKGTVVLTIIFLMQFILSA